LSAALPGATYDTSVCKIVRADPAVILLTEPQPGHKYARVCRSTYGQGNRRVRSAGGRAMDRENELRSPKSSLPTGGGASGSSSNSGNPDDIKAPPRDDLARPEPRRGRKLRTVVGAAAVLGGGWVIGLNSQFDIAQGRVWFDEGATKLSSAFASVQRGIVTDLSIGLDGMFRPLTRS
jgi:hypothetical protein